MSLIDVCKIMSLCCVFACTNNFYNNRNVHYYRFPFYKERDTHQRQVASVKQRMAWINALKGKSNVTLENIVGKRICSAHFVAGEKADCMEENESWAPTIGLCVQENSFSENGKGSTYENERPDTISNTQSEESEESTPVLSPIERETNDFSEIILSMEKYDKLMTKMSEETAAYVNKLRKVVLAQARQIEELKAELEKQVRH